MTRRNRQYRLLAVAAMVVVATLFLPGRSAAQPAASKSEPLARELAQLLESNKLDSVAARDTATPDRFVGALYFPGLQLLVVSAQYAAPPLMNERLFKREYRDVYIDLNSASIPTSKIFVEDLRANGLFADREGDQPFDIYEDSGKRTMFDGEWKRQKMSQKDYFDTYTAADEAYAHMLSVLIAELKKGS